MNLMQKLPPGQYRSARKLLMFQNPHFFKHRGPVLGCHFENLGFRSAYPLQEFLLFGKEFFGYKLPQSGSFWEFAAVSKMYTERYWEKPQLPHALKEVDSGLS